MKTLQWILAFAIALHNMSFAQEVKNKQQTQFTIEAFEEKLKEAGADAQILDARTEEEYKKNHLKGAVCFSAENEEGLQKKIDKLNKNKPIFIYSIGNGRSGQLAKKLTAQGFKQVYDLPGGFSHWVGSGRPVVSTTDTGLTLAEYNKLTNSDKLVLVDFGSRYCGGCKRMLPVVDSVANENTNTINVVKIEFFENKQLGKDLNIEALPTFILYKGDKIVWQKTGVFTKEVFDKEIKKLSNEITNQQRIYNKDEQE